MTGQKPERSYLLAFIDKTAENDSIDAQDFWKTREFASPGNFEFKREGLDKKTTQVSLDSQGFILDTSHLYPFLTYSSNSWESIEFLTEETHLMTLLPDIKTQCITIIFENENELICQKKDNSFLIVFLKSFEEMKQANAFFDFAGRDDKIVEGKQWLVVSTATL